MARPKKTKVTEILAKEEQGTIFDQIQDSTESKPVPLIEEIEFEDLEGPVECFGMFKHGILWHTLKVVVSNGKIVSHQIFEGNPKAISIETLKIEIGKKYL